MQRESTSERTAKSPTASKKLLKACKDGSKGKGEEKVEVVEGAFKPIPEELLLHIESLPKLNTLLPYTFNGGTIEDIGMCCGSCQKTILTSLMHAEIINQAGGDAAKVSAWGVCYECRKLTPMSAIFQTEGVVIFKTEKGWQKKSWGSPEKSKSKSESESKVGINWQSVVPPLLAVFVVGGWIAFKLA